MALTVCYCPPRWARHRLLCAATRGSKVECLVIQTLPWVVRGMCDGDCGRAALIHSTSRWKTLDSGLKTHKSQGLHSGGCVW